MSALDIMLFPEEFAELNRRVRSATKEILKKTSRFW